MGITITNQQKIGETEFVLPSPLPNATYCYFTTYANPLTYAYNINSAVAYKFSSHNRIKIKENPLKSVSH